MAYARDKKRVPQGEAKERCNVYQRVTEQVMALLEQGIRPWLKPWSGGAAAERISRPLRFQGKPYGGVNVLVLWCAAEEHGYASPYWMTFKQALELGGNVRKGEHGTPVVYASTFKVAEENDQGDEVEKDIPFLKQYMVFNSSQCEGLPKRYQEAMEEPVIGNIERLQGVQGFVNSTKAVIREGGNEAYYNLSQDIIRMPRLEAFRDAENHAAVLLHELCHWTRHPSRLDRDLGPQAIWRCRLRHGRTGR